MDLTNQSSGQQNIAIKKSLMIRSSSTTNFVINKQIPDLQTIHKEYLNQPIIQEGLSRTSRNIQLPKTSITLPSAQDQMDNIIGQQLLTQRLYSRLRKPTGSILPNELVSPIQPSSLFRDATQLGELTTPLKRSISVLSRNQNDTNQEQNTRERESSSLKRKIKVLLPKIVSKKNLKLDTSPQLPTLPFPRVHGNEVISPFKRSGEGNLTQRFNMLQLTSSLKDDSISSNSQLPRVRSSSKVGLLQALRDANQTNTSSTLRLFNEPSHLSQVSSVKTVNQNPQAAKTLAILEMHQNKKLMFQDNKPAEEKVEIQMASDVNKPIVIQRNRKIEVREYMIAKGLNPTPLDFYKLVTNDHVFQDFFCYCNRMDDFYDFEVVPFSHKNDNEYVTVSQRGLIHFIKGQPNFMSIMDWERETNIFRKMKKIPFFSNFKSWKTFGNWKTIMRRTMFAKTQDFLKRELFLLDAELSKPLLDMRMKTYQINKQNLVSIHSEAPLSLADFEKQQERQRKGMAENLVKVEKDVKQLLTDSCMASMRTFKEENRIAITDEFFGSGGNDEEKIGQEAFLVGDETHKQMPYTQEATLKTHFRKLSKFVRLADFFILDARFKLINHAINFVIETIKLDFSQNRKHLINDKVQGCAIFEIIVDLAEQKIQFNPFPEEICKIIIHSIQLGAECVNNYCSYLQQSDYEKYAKAIIKDEIFNEDNEHLQLALGTDFLDYESNQIRSIIQQSFDQLRSFTENYERYFQLYSDHLEFDVEATKNYDQEQLHNLLVQLNQQAEEIEKMDVKRTIEIFKINGDDLKAKIKTQAINCINSLKQYVPHIQYDRFQEVYLSLSKDYSKISKRPRKVDDYVSLMSSLRDITSNMDDYTSQFHEAERLLVLMDEHKIRLPERNRTKLRETQALVIDTKKAMVEAFEGSQGYKLSFKKELVEIEIPKLKKKIDEMRVQLQAEGFYESEKTPIQDAVVNLEKIGDQVKKAKNRGQQLNQFQRFLDMDETAFEQANDIFEDWQMKSNLWNGLKQWNQISGEWLQTKFVDIDVEDLTQKVESYHKMACICQISMKENQMTGYFKKSVENLRATIPVVTYLRDQSLEARHWEEIFQTLNMRIDLQDENFTLNSLIELNVLEHKDKIEEISLKAHQEKDLEKQIEKLISDWKKVVFETKQHKDQYYIIVPNEQLNSFLEESLQQLSKMLSMRFVDRVRAESEILYKKLQYFENLMNEWINFQRSWMYLENIFNSADIANKMGADAKRFFQIDNLWKDIMKHTHQNPLISRVTAGFNQVNQPGINIFLQQSHQINYLQVFQESNRVLEEIQTSLEILLERKRGEFPRFYFLSNDELLQILSQASRNPLYVEIHLRKLFENVVKIVLDGDDIVEIASAEGETHKIKRVKAQGMPVERWLQNLHESVIQMVKRSIKDAKNTYREDLEDFKRVEWVLEDYPAQSIALVASIAWCTTTEQILRSETDDDTLEGLDWWNAENIKQLNELTKVISRTNIDAKKRRSIVALITQDVHYRDIVEILLRSAFHNVVSLYDFQWQSQLRYYYHNDQDVSIKQVNSSFDYGYEYQGATTRIVITPLTDRCWLTITGALHLKLGAAPSGPAGTGKTESTKDLSKALGKYCVVFNCSDQINFKMMESLFFGLSMTGSWTCLDEFNRINIEVLSVIAQQVLSIRNALLSGKTTDVYIGEKKVDHFFPNLGIFITMNPGYKGRTELPDNLKVLFRPVSMMIPDYSLIAEIMLFSEGFQSGKILSKKMTRLYKLASEQLSQQSHYDFGMRAVKSVLVMAGQLKRANSKVPEEALLMKAMKDSNIPKFLKDDLPLFYAIINDLFPNSTTEIQRDQKMIKVIEDCQINIGLTPSEAQTEKIMQLIDTMSVRFGIMIIGQTLTGKSTIIKSLKEVHNYLKEQEDQEEYIGVEMQILNPKSIAMSELYGNFSHITHEWTDGLASSIIRQSVESTLISMKWVVFDGPVDAIWVENMNTVLDDNMTLCLSNGERIKLKTEMRILFEIDDLSQASPATVSRCGMVYASQQSLSWRPIVTSWLKGIQTKIISQKNKEHLWNLFDTHIDNTLELFRQKKYMQPIPVCENNQVITLFRMIQSIFQTEIKLREFQIDRQKKVLTKVFTYALAWAFGGSIDIKHHSSFEVYLSNALSSTSNELPRSSIFDNFLMLTSPGTPEMMIDYHSWQKVIPTDPLSIEPSSQDVIVPTKDTTRFSWLLKIHMKLGFPVFLTGMTGVGKSLISGYALNSLKNYQIIKLSFSSQTSTKETQRKIEDKLEKKKRNLLSGNKNQNVIVFVDDVNMPAYDKYGAQMPIELLRQFLDYRGFYDIDELYWKNVQNVSMLCSAAPPEGGRKVLSQRFTSHFSMFCMPPTQEDSLQKIFGTILEQYIRSYNGFRKEVISQVQRTVESTLVLFFKIQEGLKPTPQKQHYTFNLRDIQRVIGGICSTKSTVINSVERLAKLWVHETTRVFVDRLVTDQDREWLQNQIVFVLQGTLRFDLSYEQIYSGNSNITFCDMMLRGLPFEERNYQYVSDHQRLQQVIQDYVEEYNLTFPSLSIDLVLFDSCLDQILRICRILRQPRSHGLIVGVSGCGKQSATRLGSFISQCQFYSVTSKTNKITQTDFRESIKTGMRQAGVKHNRTLFMLTDYQINACATKDEVFLEDISNLLNQGDTSNLWSREDKDDIARILKAEAAENGIYENIVETFFQNRMRQNMHFIICMSPIGENFRNRLRMFPSLINCCQMSWFNEWPKEALLSVSLKFIEKIKQIQDESTRNKLARLAVSLNQAVKQECDIYMQELRRRVYLTPAGFLDFLKAYLYLMNSQQDTQSQRKQTLITGSQKLKKTKDIVDQLTENMIKMQPMLQQSIEQTEKMSRRIELEKYEASQNRKIVEAEKRIVDKQTEEVQNQYNLALQELNQVLPALIEAEDALNTLNQSDIIELRQTKSPSKGILNTMIVTFVLLEKTLEYRKINWKACQMMMSVGFFDKLKAFDKDELVKNDKLNRTLELFIQENPDFTPEIVKNSSKACFSLCKWCFALKNYAQIAKQVQPKQQMVAVMEDELKKAQAELAQKQTRLQEEMRKLDALEKQYQQVMEKKENLENEIELCHVRILRSTKLTEGLKGENDRWKECLLKLEEEADYLISEVFLAATTISYLGPFNGANRKKILDQVKHELREYGIAVSLEQRGIEEVICDLLEVQNWRICGLPSDWVSVGNAVIATKSLKVPLIIDPQQQGIKWIKNMSNKGSTLDNQLLYEARLGTKEFDQIAELAICQGKSLLLEDVGCQIDSCLDPLILKQYYKGMHGRVLINFGGQTLDYDPNFKLYLSIRDPNPHLLPEVFMNFTVINFTVTQEGLAEQLLVDIVRLENQELEARRVQISNSIASDQVRMVKIQEDILTKLVNSSEDTILDDEVLIEHLDISKIMSEDIKKSIDEKNIAQAEIIKQRMIYEDLAERGSILYFTIFDLGRIEIMYQHSLDQFKRLFVQIIRDQPQMSNQTKRISILMREIIRVIYKFVCRGLFHNDKLIFALILALRISLNQKMLTIQEFELFLKGVGFVSAPPAGLILQFKQPDSSLLSDKNWKFILSIEFCHPFFTGIAKSFETNLDEWVEWINAKDLGEMPADWELRLSHFQKLMLVKCLREQNLIDQIKTYVMNELGYEFIDIKPNNLEEVHRDSDCKTPITFILQQGVDPTAQFMQLYQKVQQRASQTNSFEQQLHIISLGQGQDKYALSSLDKAQKSGQWILLQNCHLYESFMPTLERIVVTMPEKCHEFHKDFRLFLTSMPCEFFPSSILQSSIKVTFEAAKGIKANLLSTIPRLTSQKADEQPISQKQRIIQYSLCFFHAVVQERRKFGSLGWNIQYEFNESDFDTGLSIIRDMMGEDENGKDIMWDSIQQVIGDVVYGGRVTDDIDRRTLKNILRNFISEQVLKSDYSYSESGIYKPIIDFEDLELKISQLPENDMPEIFGMNEIADLACSMRDSQTILDSLLLIQPRTVAVKSDSSKQESVISQDIQVERIANKIIENLPKLLSRDGANKELFHLNKDGLIPSMSVFLLHEIERFNMLIKVIQESLDTLIKAIKGQAVMSEEIEQMQLSLIRNKVPELWNQKAYPSLKPLASWIINLQDRIEFLRTWLSKGSNVIGYWLSAFFFPQGFLTSVLQNFARRTKTAIDTLSFSFEVLTIQQISDITTLHPQVRNQAILLETVLIQGLYTTCGWINPKSLYLDDAPKGQQNHACPIIAFKPVIISESTTNERKTYSCPLYKTSERVGTLSTTGHSTNFIINIDLPSARDPSYWILRGTALLCQLDD